MIRKEIRRGPYAPGIVLSCLALLAALILGGCAPQRQWVTTGGSQAEFDQDAARCRREAAKATYRDPFATTPGLEYAVAQERIFAQCMVAKGYRQEEKPSGR